MPEKEREQVCSLIREGDVLALQTLLKSHPQLGTWAARKHREAGYGRPVDRGVWTAKTVKRPRQQPAHPQYANYWAPLTRKRHTMPHSAQSQHTNYWAPRTRKRHQQEHRPQRPKESSDPTQHAEGRTGDRPGPRKEITTRRNVTQGAQHLQHHLADVGHREPAAVLIIRLMLSRGASLHTCDVNGRNSCRCEPESKQASKTSTRSRLAKKAPRFLVDTLPICTVVDSSCNASFIPNYASDVYKVTVVVDRD